MKKIIRCAVYATALILPFVSRAQTRDELQSLRSSVEADLVENILPFWTENTVDPDGGFHGTVMDRNKPVAGSDKGSILNARILWAYSRAYRQYAIPEYRAMADRAAAYFVDHFIDRKFGGVIWSTDSEGNPKDMTKQTYASAFGVYGLAEHFRSTGDVRSLDAALSIYRTIEGKAHDKSGLGYVETFNRDYSDSSMKGVDGKEGATRTMNTHIHLLEAYTTLYRIWPDSQLRDNLIELIGLLQNKLYDTESKHLILYCDDAWNPLGKVDSYGHDIEASWLLVEAAEAVGDERILSEARRQAVEMVDAALREGMSANGAMLYERNEKGLREELSWWPQCETVIGCINAWQITGKKEYFSAAMKTWAYAESHFVDKVNGGWFKKLTPDGKPAKEAKASMWNCPYHNSRMALELADRLEWPSTHTEVMAWSNITGVRMEGELFDFESSLRVGVPGSKMEVTAKERQNKIRYRREGMSQITTTPMHGALITQTVTDVDMSTVNLSWEAEALENLNEAAYFCIDLAPGRYASAEMKISGRKLSVKTSDRSMEISFSKSVKMSVREENGHRVIYVTLLPRLSKGAKVNLSAVMTLSCKPDHDAVEIRLDPESPGREFTGFGGNFRIQNVRKDPEVIDYCMENMRVAFGRVEFPWAQWDRDGAGADHIRRSAGMAARLKAQGIPVIVSCWFPPEWAGVKTTRSDGTAVAYSLRSEEKGRIFESIASYLVFLKKEYGVEADYFSFNESDLGIDVVFTPEEHRDFIKEFGSYLAGRGLKTLMLLGDNSDATTFDFIVPTLEDTAARRYVGAISFHSWRGCDDATLARWAEASRRINVPLIVGEGSTDAAAHQYAGIFNETTFALYEINLYTRICAISQPWSILQWQLTSDYSLLWGDGIYGSDGPLRPTQRFFNLKQLSMTPSDSFAMPATAGKDNVNVASFVKPSTGEAAVHVVNNAASCTAKISGLPSGTSSAIVYITNGRQHAEASFHEVHDGCIEVFMPADSFVSIMTR